MTRLSATSSYGHDSDGVYRRTVKIRASGGEGVKVLSDTVRHEVSLYPRWPGWVREAAYYVIANDGSWYEGTVIDREGGEVADGE